jgi:hypothetical protein
MLLAETENDLLDREDTGARRDEMRRAELDAVRRDSVRRADMAGCFILFVPGVSQVEGGTKVWRGGQRYLAETLKYGLDDELQGILCHENR